MCAVLECTLGVLCAGDSAYSAARSYFDEQFEEPEELSTDSDNDYTVFCWGQHTVVLTRLLEGEDTTHSATASHILGIFPDISFFLVLAASGSEKPIVGETPLIIEKTVGIITSRDNRADVSENVERTVRILDATHLAPPHLLKNGFAILDLLQMKGMTLDELRRRFQTIFKLFLPRSKPRKPRVARPIADVPAQLSGSEEDKDMEKESRSVSQNGSGREDMGEKEKDEEDGSSQEMGELITGSATGISRDGTSRDSSLRSRRAPMQEPGSQSHLLPASTYGSDHNMTATVVIPGDSRGSLQSSIFHRSSLIAALLFFEFLSAFMIATAVHKIRKPSCTPQIETVKTDDGFWVLLSQLFILVLSTYCTLFVAYTSEEMTLWLDRFWFNILLFVGVSTAVSAVAVYPWSWKIATILSFVSGSAQVVSLGQIAANLHPSGGSPV